jgi:hypothetical protein
MIALLTDTEALTLYERVAAEYKAQEAAREGFRHALNELSLAKVESNLAWAAFVTACGDAPTAMALMEWRHKAALAEKGQ